MNYAELRDFINLLDENEINKEVKIVDEIGGVILDLSGADFSTDKLYATYDSGIIYLEEIGDSLEMADIVEDTYNIVEVAYPILTCK